MGNIAIATPEISDLATLGTSSEVSTMAIGNLQTMQPAEIWRSTVTSATINIDLASSKSFNLVSLLYTNLSSAATWRVRSADSSAVLVSTTVPYDSSTIKAWPSSTIQSDWDYTHSVLWLSSSQVFRFLRIDINDPSPRPPTGSSAAVSATYVQAGRLIVASARQPTTNIQYGWGMGWNDLANIQRAANGAAYPDAKGMVRSLSFSLEFATASEMFDWLFQIDRRRGAHRDLFIIRDPEDTAQIMNQSIYGLQSGDMRPVVNDDYAIYSKQFNIVELI